MDQAVIAIYLMIMAEIQQVGSYIIETLEQFLFRIFVFTSRMMVSIYQGIANVS